MTGVILEKFFVRFKLEKMFEKKIINKIGIIINWTRELDYWRVIY